MLSNSVVESHDGVEMMKICGGRQAPTLWAHGIVEEP